MNNVSTAGRIFCLDGLPCLDLVCFAPQEHSSTGLAPGEAQLCIPSMVSAPVKFLDELMVDSLGGGLAARLPLTRLMLAMCLFTSFAPFGWHREPFVKYINY